MGAWYKKSRAIGFVQSHRVHRGDRKLVCRSSLGGVPRWGQSPDLQPLNATPHRTPGAPPNCNSGRSADRVSASWCVCASLRPGKMRKAPSKEPSIARPRRMASLVTGSLRREGLRESTIGKNSAWGGCDPPSTCTSPQDPVPSTHAQSQSCFFSTGSRFWVMLARPRGRRSSVWIVKVSKAGQPSSSQKPPRPARSQTSQKPPRLFKK